MPDLIDREPDHVRIETDLAYSSSGSPYPGLDDRFKNNWEQDSVVLSIFQKLEIGHFTSIPMMVQSCGLTE